MVALLCTLAAAALMLARDFYWPLAWIAPIPLLWLAYSARSYRTIALCVIGTVLLWVIPLVFPLLMATGFAMVPKLVWLITVLIFVLLSCLLLARRVRGQIHPLLALLAYPAAWTSAAYVFYLSSGGDTAGLDAYSQGDVPALIQTASVAGLWGIEFLLALFANAIVLCLYDRHHAPVFAGVVVALVAANLLFGLWRLSRPAGPTIRVAAAAQDLRLGGRLPRADDAVAGVVSQYAAEAQSLAGQGARIIVLPELTSVLSEDSRAAITAPLSLAAQQSGAWITMGFAEIGKSGVIHNVALTFRPDQPPSAYFKRHPLVPLDPSVPGTSPGLLGGARAVAICKDLDFPATIRNDAQHTLQLMIVPAADFGADGWIHARMALFRAVEDGFAMIRAARNGVVMITNDRGQVLARVNSTADGSSHVIADVSVGSGATIYRRFGDWFAWLSAATCVAIIGLLRKLRSQPDHRFS